MEITKQNISAYWLNQGYEDIEEMTEKIMNQLLDEIQDFISIGLFGDNFNSNTPITSISHWEEDVFISDYQDLGVLRFTKNEMFLWNGDIDGLPMPATIFTREFSLVQDAFFKSKYINQHGQIIL